MEAQWLGWRGRMMLVMCIFAATAATAAAASLGCFQQATVAQFAPSTLVTPSAAVVVVSLTESICGPGGTLPNVFLRLEGAGPMATDLVFSSSPASSTCTQLAFPVDLPDQLIPDSYSAWLQCDTRTLELPKALAIVAPPTVSLGASQLVLPPSNKAVVLPVQLSGPAVVPLSVSLAVDDPNVKVEPSMLLWGVGDSRTRPFKLSLTAAPQAANITARLVLSSLANSGVLSSSSSSALLRVAMPSWALLSGQGYYRGASKGPVKLTVRVTGIAGSSWPSTVRYCALVLPTSRPLPPDCQQGASSDVEQDGSSSSGDGADAGGGICSPLELADAWNLTASGTMRAGAGSSEDEALLTINLPVPWGEVPPEAELQLGLWLQPLSNAVVETDPLAVGGVVFGTQLGTCPPGTSRRQANSDRPDQLPYSSTAPLQELQLLMGAAATPSATSGSSSGSAPGMPGNRGSGARGSSKEGGSSAAAAAAAGRVDLDPPFRPLISTYTALLPPGSQAMQLALASSRRGDRVFVRAEGCGMLDSAGWTVDWPQRNTSSNTSSSSSSSKGASGAPGAQQGQQMWRVRYNITRVARPCWLRVYVFTNSSNGSGNSGLASAIASAAAAAAGGSPLSAATPSTGYAGDLGDAPAASASGVAAPGSREDAATAAAAAAWAAMDSSEHVLYRSYSVRLIPLHSERQLSLRSLSFISNSTQVIACGVPTRLQHLFQDDPDGDSSSSSSSSSGVGSPAKGVRSAAGALPQPLVPYPKQQVVAGYIRLQKVNPSSQPPTTGGSGSAGGALLQQPEVSRGTKAPSGTDWQQQYTLFDRSTNLTVKWTQYTPAACSPEHYVMVPLPQVNPDMQMVPELMDLTVIDSVLVQTPELMVVLSSDTGLNSSSTSSTSSSSSSGEDGSSGCGAARSGVGSRRALLGDADCPPPAARLPGIVAEMPVITMADEGRSSKTYTLLLYNNDTTAKQLQGQPAAPGGITPAAAGAAEAALGDTPVNGGQQLSDGTIDWSEASPEQLAAAVVSERPGWWPTLPAGNANCSVCINGTYSTRTNMQDCQVCPPGKFAATLLSSSCRDCPAGSFSHYWGAARCRPCLPGTFAAASGAVYCQICPDGRTTSGQGAHMCDVDVEGSVSVGGAASEYIILLSFGVVLDGTNLASVSRATTGINGSSEGIVAVLVQGDTAAALNVSLHAVEIGGVSQINARQLLVNVSATVPLDAEKAALQKQQDLSADELVQRLIDDPDTFLRTTQTLGAESASITDLTAHNVHLQHTWLQSRLHAVLWPTLFATLLVLVTLVCSCWHWRWSRRHKKQLVLQGARGLPGITPGHLLAQARLGAASSSGGTALPPHGSTLNNSSSSSSSKPASRVGWRWRLCLQERWRFRVKVEWWSAEEASPPSTPPPPQPLRSRAALLPHEAPPGYFARLRNKQAAVAAGLEMSPSSKSSYLANWGMGGHQHHPHPHQHQHQQQWGSRGSSRHGSTSPDEQAPPDVGPGAGFR